jgi:hypothetical protein
MEVNVPPEVEAGGWTGEAAGRCFRESKRRGEQGTWSVGDPVGGVTESRRRRRRGKLAGWSELPRWEGCLDG